MESSNSINFRDIESDVLKQLLVLQQEIVFTDPTLDGEFKRLFATPGNEDLLLMLTRQHHSRKADYKRHFR